MPDDPREPGGWELHRDIQGLSDDLKSLRTELNARLDKMPTQDLMSASLAQYTVQVASLADDLMELKAQREADVREHKADRDRERRERQWLIGAVLVPLAISLMSLVVALGGIR